jgi:hypothetical protein
MESFTKTGEYKFAETGSKVLHEPATRNVKGSQSQSTIISALISRRPSSLSYLADCRIPDHVLKNSNSAGHSPAGELKIVPNVSRPAALQIDVSDSIRLQVRLV